MILKIIVQLKHRLILERALLINLDIIVFLHSQ